jgi:glutaredoxin 3
MPPITIYTRSWCSYCSAAKQLLSQRGAAFTEIDIEAKPGARQEMVQKAGGRTSVPQIFIGERHVGGYDDLYSLDRQGQLDPLLRA